MKNSLILGDFIGEGVARKVYHWLPDPNLVAKIQMRESYEDRDYQNIAEYQLWESASKIVKKFLAPIHYISPCGTLVLQSYCGPIISPGPIPKQIPKVLTDTHQANWGWYDGRAVLVDYGRHWAIEMACNAKKMHSGNNDEHTPSLR